MTQDINAEHMEKVEKILEWAKDRPEFDKSFVESIHEALEKYGSLTARQAGALDNIIQRFEI